MKKITPRSAHIPAWRNARSRDDPLCGLWALAVRRA